MSPSTSQPAPAADEPAPHLDGSEHEMPNDDVADEPARIDAEAPDLAAQLEAATAERNDYLDQLQRQRAEFQNFRRRVEAERRQQVSAGVSRLVESLLPVLDGCAAATAQGHSEVAAVGQALMVALGKAGLERIDAVGEPFDPTQHEAVTIEVAPDPDPDPDEDGSGNGETSGETAGPDGADPTASDDRNDHYQVVTEELRSGFRFDGRVLRAAMVKVRTA
ncbi:nucleotide exchange factor GrpE [Candidatus Poriferisodalis sp.]|uniref:nucleotide exchange factor GrpE n=1 Tax=Candidatus Poriferisodalis sp. TaxID=3101277 RepID=UPI003C6EE516